jgi:hypothetical protein
VLLNEVINRTRVMALVYASMDDHRLMTMAHISKNLIDGICVDLMLKKRFVDGEFNRLLNEIRIDLTLQQTLHPMSFDAELHFLKEKYVEGTLDHIFDFMDSFISRSDINRMCFIKGEGGTGKTSAIAAIAERFSESVAAVHIFDGGIEIRKNASRMVLNIIFQLAVKFPEYRKSLEERLLK